MPNNLTYNLERYRNCFCNKDRGSGVVRLFEFSHEKRSVIPIFNQEILFILQGGAYIALDGINAGKTLKKGEFVFLPAGSRVACDIMRNSLMLVVSIPADIPECPVFGINRALEFRYHEELENIHAMKANHRILNFISELLVSLEEGFLCRHFLEGEATRLLYLLNAYYPEEERLKFFSHILTPDIKFSEFVRMNHMKYRTIGDMSDALCMTSQAFANRFKKVFGMTPHKWIQQERARQIYIDICRSEIPLKEIAQKYDFPMTSNFFRFCRHAFGESPGNIRKNLRMGMSLNRD